MVGVIVKRLIVCIYCILPFVLVFLNIKEILLITPFGRIGSESNLGSFTSFLSEYFYPVGWFVVFFIIVPVGWVTLMFILGPLIRNISNKIN